MKSNKGKLVAALGMFICLITGLSSYYEQSMTGLPDGHLTEYDRFYKNMLHPIYLGLNLLFFLIFMSSIFVKNNPKRTFILYIIVLVAYHLVQYYFSLNLANGQGG